MIVNSSNINYELLKPNIKNTNFALIKIDDADIIIKNSLFSNNFVFVDFMDIEYSLVLIESIVFDKFRLTSGKAAKSSLLQMLFFRISNIKFHNLTISNSEGIGEMDFSYIRVEKIKFYHLEQYF